MKIAENAKEHEENVGTHFDFPVRAGAQRMLKEAVEAEVGEYVQRFRDERDGDGHRLVVRNGTARPRKIVTGAGTIGVAVPRVNDRRVVNGERAKLTSRILPPYMRRSPKVAEIHLSIRIEEYGLRMLVIVGVRPDGTKELIAVEDGYRESTDSWSAVLRSLRDRGMQAPLPAVGDGALGFWGAVRDVWPETREQRCWFHKLGNILDKLPKRLQPKAK